CRRTDLFLLSSQGGARLCRSRRTTLRRVASRTGELKCGSGDGAAEGGAEHRGLGLPQRQQWHSVFNLNSEIGKSSSSSCSWSSSRIWGSQFAELNAQNSCAKVCLLLGVKSPCRGRPRGRGGGRFPNF